MATPDGVLPTTRSTEPSQLPKGTVPTIRAGACMSEGAGYDPIRTVDSESPCMTPGR